MNPPSLIVCIGAAAIIGGVLGVSGQSARSDSNEEPSLATAKQASPDTPPAEFAYLDSSRAPAYLGQIQHFELPSTLSAAVGTR